MLDRGFFDIRRNGCIDPLPARSNDLWTDLVIEPLTGNSNDKFDGRKFNWIGTANGIHDLPMLVQRGSCSIRMGRSRSRRQRSALGVNHAPFSTDAFAAEGLAHPTTFGSLLQWARKAKY
jgi:hypothetical protein